MISQHTVGFDPADRLPKDPESVRKRFWAKFKRVAARLPFAEDLLSAYYCAFDSQTPRHVQAALLGAIAYFILPFDFIPDMLPVLGSPTMPRCWRPRFVWWRPVSRRNIARRRAPG
jgi:hypothetical protein